MLPQVPRQAAGTLTWFVVEPKLSSISLSLTLHGIISLILDH
jgi:hypothetical protein